MARYTTCEMAGIPLCYDPKFQDFKDPKWCKMQTKILTLEMQFKNSNHDSQNYSVLKITTVNNSCCPSYASYLAKSGRFTRTVHFKQGM